MVRERTISAYKSDVARGRAFLLEGHCIQMRYHNQAYEKVFVEMLFSLVNGGHQVMARPLNLLLPNSRWRRAAALTWQQRECHFFIAPGDPDKRCRNCRPEDLVMQRLRGRKVTLVQIA